MTKVTQEQVKAAAFKLLTENKFIRSQEGIDKFESKLRQELNILDGVFKLQSYAELDQSKREVPEIIFLG